MMIIIRAFFIEKVLFMTNVATFSYILVSYPLERV
jgi:hypothetical protein